MLHAAEHHARGFGQTMTSVLPRQMLDEPWFNHDVEWEGGILAEESTARLQAFFKAKR